MENISLVKYSPYSSDYLATAKMTAQLVECYRSIFMDTPWHEWLKCPKCEKYWGVKDSEDLVLNKFLHCDTPLIDFWPREKVIYDIYHEITKEASCWLAMNNSMVIGFCWGYPIVTTELENN
jgi:hypothetical protein